MQGVDVRPIGAGDRDWARAFLRERWGGERMLIHGRVVYPAEQAGFIAAHDHERVGLVTYDVAGGACEITVIESINRYAGIGTLLLRAVEGDARRTGCSRLWLVTTNDNLDALRFYQRRGFYLSALHRGAVDISRQLKSAIPLVGEYGIPLRDELELEKHLD